MVTPQETEVIEKIEVDGGEVTITKEPIPETQYCDLLVACKCGETCTIGKGIEGGLQLVIVPKEESYVLLHCNKCLAELKLYLVPGEKPDKQDFEITEVKNEDVSQENKSEESL